MTGLKNNTKGHLHGFIKILDLNIFRDNAGVSGAEIKVVLQGKLIRFLRF
jgi:hypothetical protein